MSGSTDNNVILFPKTIEYYQTQLTRLLETEQYNEALELLDFLMGCQTDDTWVYDEWHTLAEWLKTTITPEEEVEESESDMFKERIRKKASEDRQYIQKLLDQLLQAEVSLENKLLSLEQLSVLEHPNINETLKRWLTTMELHPLVVFRALQTLRNRGAQGELTINNCGEQVTVRLEDIPLAFHDMPEPFQLVISRLRHVSEVNQPTLIFFAEQMWQQFSFFIYGTSLYNLISHLKEDSIGVWASALHHTVMEMMIGQADELETKQPYLIDSSQTFEWEQALKTLHRFTVHAVSSP